MCFINRQNGSTLSVIRKMRVKYAHTHLSGVKMRMVENAKCW